MLADSPTRDRAIIGIIAGNALTLAAALAFDWGVVQLLWPFWIQSVIIGWFARRRILALTDFSAEGVRFNGRPIAADAGAKVKIANFFALHFGLFHVVYLVFLLAFSLTADPAGYIQVTHADTGTVSAVHVGRVVALDWLVFAVLGYAFWRAHRASHAEHVAADLSGRPGIGMLMMMPYARVVPMHLTILLGVLVGGGAWANGLFVLMKTVADVVMHRWEHRRLQGHAGADRSRKH